MGIFNCDLLFNNMGRKFSPLIFLDDFKEGFKEGLQNLENEYEIKDADFYHANKKENLVTTLKYILYEKDFEQGRYLGLIKRIDSIPLQWTSEIIRLYGFYNGFLHSIVELKNKFGFDLNNDKPQISYSAQEENKNEIQENPYPQIFKDKKAFEFFERLLEEYDIANSKTKISILSDIYILMRKDDLIFESFKPTPFVNWLNEKYDFNISKLKELTRTPLVTTKKIYNNSKQLFFTNKE